MIRSSGKIPVKTMRQAINASNPSKKVRNPKKKVRAPSKKARAPSKKVRRPMDTKMDWDSDMWINKTRSRR